MDVAAFLGWEEGAELGEGHGEEGVEVDAAVREFAEGAAVLVECGAHVGDKNGE